MTPTLVRSPHRSAGTTAALLLVLSFLAGLLAVAPALPAAADDDVIRTRFALLSGHPSEKVTDPPSRGVVVVPGAVFRLGAGSPPVGDAEARSRELASVGEKLRRTLRLEDVQTLYAHELSLAIDRTEELPAPTATSTVRIQVTLQGYNADLATYRVRFRDGRSTFADSVVSVERRGRALVGGLDGEEAPYLFLVIEPVGGPSWVRQVDDGITPPRAVHRVAPTYSAEAKELRIQGVVILKTTIDEAGQIRHFEVLKGLPGGLTEAAIEAVRQWTFTPALDEAGRPVAVDYNLTINFRLDDDVPGALEKPSG